MTNFVLYRHFTGDGQLLYVGVTNNPVARWRSHRRTKVWWPEVVHTTYALFGSREDLLAAERAAIIAERPAYNVAHNSRRVVSWRTLGWDEAPNQEDWDYTYEVLVESADSSPAMTAGAPLFGPTPTLSPAALDWCLAHAEYAHIYGISKSPVFTDRGFLPWLRGRAYRNDGISDVVADIRRDPALRGKKWSAQQLWVYIDRVGACSAFKARLVDAVAEYEAQTQVPA